MKLQKAVSRDRKKSRHKMRVSGKSVFTIVQSQIRRSQNVRNNEKSG